MSEKAQLGNVALTLVYSINCSKKVYVRTDVSTPGEQPRRHPFGSAEGECYASLFNHDSLVDFPGCLVLSSCKKELECGLNLHTEIGHPVSLLGRCSDMRQCHAFVCSLVACLVNTDLTVTQL